MKKLILFMALIFFAIPAYAQLSDAYNATKIKVTELVTSTEKSKDNCPVYSDTPRSQINRSAWEVELGFPFLDFPNNGPRQFRTDNFSLRVVHNLSSALNVYARYDKRSVDKYDYENSTYDPAWETFGFFAGIQLYVMPTFSVGYGIGYISAKDLNDEEVDLEAATEWVFSFHQPFWDGKYKVIFSYNAVEAKLQDAAEQDVSAAVADGSYSTLSASLSIPLGY